MEQDREAYKEALQMRAKLMTKVCELMKGVPKIQDDDKNSHSGYKFVSYKRMNQYLLKKLPELGLLLVPSVTSVEEREISGGKGTRSIVHMTFDLFDTETGFSAEYRWVSADQDFGGKSVSQAQTEGVKRFWFKLLNVHGKGEAKHDDTEIDPDSRTVNNDYKQTRNPPPPPANGENRDRIDHMLQALRGKNLNEKQVEMLTSFAKQFHERGTLSTKQTQILTDIHNQVILGKGR